jgi:hypothetical protein
MNLRDLNTEMIVKGGFSYSLTFGDMSGTENYACAMHKATENVFDDLPTQSDYIEYVNNHITLLAREDFVLGGWEHEGRFYLDVAQLLPKDEYSESNAIDVAVEREQLAIHDLETGNDVTCGDECFKCGAYVPSDEVYCPKCRTNQ